jgi:hypothetical protein
MEDDARINIGSRLAELGKVAYGRHHPSRDRLSRGQVEHAAIVEPGARSLVACPVRIFVAPPEVD